MGEPPHFPDPFANVMVSDSILQANVPTERRQLPSLTVMMVGPPVLLSACDSVTGSNFVADSRCCSHEGINSRSSSQDRGVVVVVQGW